jgi:hypothetical protein
MTVLQWTPLASGDGELASGETWTYLITRDSYQVVFTRYGTHYSGPGRHGREADAVLVARQAAANAISLGGAYDVAPEAAVRVIAHLKQCIQGYENGEDIPAYPAWRHPRLDYAGTEQRILDAEASRYRYFVAYPGEPEREVNVDAWRAAERAAGFIPALGYGNATASFTGRGYRGRTELIPAPEPAGTWRTGRSSGRPENPGTCPSCGSPARGELYYVAGRNGPVSCSSDWHDRDAREPGDAPHDDKDQETRT